MKQENLKKVIKQSSENLDIIFIVLEILKEKGIDGIPITMKPHRLKGNYKNNWEFHIKPDLFK